MNLEEILGKLKESKEITFDFETTDLHHRLMSVDGISFASDKLEPTFLRFSDYDTLDVRDFMKKAFTTSALYIGHNLMFDCKVLKYFYGVEVPNKFDTMVAAWYLDENRLKGLKDLSKDLLGTPMESYASHTKEERLTRLSIANRMAEEELGETAKKKDIKSREKEIFEELPVDNSWLDEYGALDSEQTYKLYKLFRPLLENESLYDLFYELEMPFLDVLIDMTLTGIDTDIDLLKRMERHYYERQLSLENKIYEFVGEFNIGSTMQLSEKLFGIKVSRKGGRVHLEDVRISGVEYVRPAGFTATGAPSTDEKTLNKLPNSELVNLIREYRGVSKLLNTYAKGYQTFVVDGKIYPNFNGDGRDESDGGTVTGRLSCSKPNMMNLPRERKEDFFIRDAFYAPEGYNLIVTDESQLELRLLAHYSQDPGLVSAFLSGEDVHRRTAQQILRKEEVTPEERVYFKTINFAIMYGMSYKALAEKLEISDADSKRYLGMYFDTYSGVQDWMKWVHAQVAKKGYVTTILGRKRRLPDIWSTNYGEKSRAQRQAVNSIIQGSAADILKVAMLKIHDQFRGENLDTHIQLQIHDELVILSKKVDTERACDIIQEYMEHPFAVDLKVPLEAIPKVVKNWGQAKD